MAMFTNYMSEFTETERKQYSALAARNFEDLTTEEALLVSRWNTARVQQQEEFDEFAEQQQTQDALIGANIAAERTRAFAALDALLQESLDRYEESKGGE